MSIIKAKIDYSKNGPNDEYYTPFEAVEMIIPFIPQEVRTIWECTALEGSRIVEVLRANGYNVIATHIKDGFDFFEYEPEDYDMTITNPPYSLKDIFLQRAFELKKPFMFLLPTTTLEGLKRGKMFREHRIQLLVPNRRFSFTEKKSGAWFHTSWFTYGLELENDLNFVCLSRRVLDINDVNNELDQAA
jgi:hypothetical protein